MNLIINQFRFSSFGKTWERGRGWRRECVCVCVCACCSVSECIGNNRSEKWETKWKIMPARHIQDTGTLSLRASEWWVSGWSCLFLCRIHTAVLVWSSEPQAAVFLFTPFLCQYINKSVALKKSNYFKDGRINKPVALCNFQRSLDWILTANNWSRT